MPEFGVRALILPSPGAGGRLSDFRFAGSLAPVLAFVGISAAAYFWGTRSFLTILIQLWVAYSLAFVVLAILAKIKGSDASWYYVLPTAFVGVAVGSLASALVPLTLNSAAMLNSSSLAREWAIGSRIQRVLYWIVNRHW